MGVLTLALMNQKEWANSSKWNVKFSTGSNPDGYLGWLPATDVAEPLFTIGSYEFSAGHRTFGLPKSLDFPQLSISYVDDDQRTILNFHKTWCNKIFPNNGASGIAYLTAAVKTVEVEHLTLQNEVLYTHKYLVYPEGSMALSLNSNSAPLAFSLNYRVVGKYPD